MSVRRRLCVLLAGAHLVIVVCGAADCLPKESVHSPAKFIRWYAAMSGADSRYGFFAPQVGSTHRARFLLQDDQGSTWWDAFDQTNSLEARLRLSGIVDNSFMSGEADESPGWRRDLVRSWGAKMLSHHPSAVSLIVVVEAYIVPTMADFRAGSRPSWQQVYQAQLRRN